MELTLIECLDCHVIFPGHENHSCKIDKISFGIVEKGLLNRYVKGNGAPTSDVQYVSGAQSIDCNIFASARDTGISVKHAESRCPIEDFGSDYYFVNGFANSQNVKFMEPVQGNLHHNISQNHFSDPNRLRENSAYIFPIEQHSITLQQRDHINGYLGYPVSALLNISKLYKDIVSTTSKNTSSACGKEDNNTESDDKMPHEYDPKFASILQAHYEQPSLNAFNQIPIETYRMETAEVSQSLYLNNDNYQQDLIENVGIESLIPLINIDEVKDTLESFDFADGQKGMWPLNESSTVGNSRSYDYASNEARNENKLQAGTSDGNPFSGISGINFETQYRIQNGRYICLICGKSLGGKVNFVRHFRIHSGEKRYICNECGKGFTQKNALDIHLLTHNGEKPHVCDECGKRFAQKSHLSIHLMTHTGEKPCVCDECGTRFTQKGHLSRHILTHTGEKRFVCNWCQKRFSRKDKLVSHMRTHGGGGKLFKYSFVKMFFKKLKLFPMLKERIS